MTTLTDMIDTQIKYSLSDEQCHKVWDLALWAINTGELFRSTFSGIQKNLYKKYINGELAEAQAKKAFINTIPKVLKMHNSESKFKYTLNNSEKEVVAEELLCHYTMDFELYPNGGLFADA